MFCQKMVSCTIKKDVSMSCQRIYSCSVRRYLHVLSEDVLVSC